MTQDVHSLRHVHLEKDVVNVVQGRSQLKNRNGTLGRSAMPGWHFQPGWGCRGRAGPRRSFRSTEQIRGRRLQQGEGTRPQAGHSSAANFFSVSGLRRIIARGWVPRWGTVCQFPGVPLSLPLDPLALAVLLLSALPRFPLPSPSAFQNGVCAVATSLLANSSLSNRPRTAVSKLEQGGFAAQLKLAVPPRSATTVAPGVPRCSNQRWPAKHAAPKFGFPIMVLHEQCGSRPSVKTTLCLFIYLLDLCRPLLLEGHPRQPKLKRRVGISELPYVT